MKFSEILEIRNGKNQRNVENPNGNYPIYGSGGIMGWADDYICPANTVIIGRKGSINNPIYVETPFWNVDTAFGLVSNDKIILPKYLYYFCRSFDFEALNTTVTIPSLTKANLLQIEIDVPPLDEQRNIVEILDSIEKSIALYNKQLAKFDTLVKSRFIEMFGDPVTNPMGWPIQRLGDLVTKITNGNTPKGGSKVYVNKGILFFRSQNVWRNRLDFNDIAYIDAKTHEQLHESSLRHNDILITKTGRINTENSSLGRAALYDGGDDLANINGHVYLIRLKEGINQRYVLEILISESYRDLIRRVCVGGIDKRQINKNHVEDFPIIVPPVALQNQFSAFVQQVDKSKSVLQKLLEKQELLRAALMQEYFG